MNFCIVIVCEVYIIINFALNNFVIIRNEKSNDMFKGHLPFNPITIGILSDDLVFNMSTASFATGSVQVVVVPTEVVEETVVVISSHS